jgi:hypothetical protein
MEPVPKTKIRQLDIPSATTITPLPVARRRGSSPGCMGFLFAASVLIMGAYAVLVRTGNVGIEQSECTGGHPLGKHFNESIDIMYQTVRQTFDGVNIPEHLAFRNEVVPCLQSMNTQYDLDVDAAAHVFLDISLASAWGYKPSFCAPPPSGSSDAPTCSKNQLYDYMENTPISVTTLSGTRRCAERCDMASNVAYLSGVVVLYKLSRGGSSSPLASVSNETVKALMQILVMQAFGSITFHGGGSTIGAFPMEDASDVPPARMFRPNTSDVFGFNDKSFAAAFPPNQTLGAVGYVADVGRLFDTIPTSLFALHVWEEVAAPLYMKGWINESVYRLNRIENATELLRKMQTVYTLPRSQTLDVLNNVKNQIPGYREIFPAIVTSGFALLGDTNLTRSVLKELNTLLGGASQAYDEIILPILAVQEQIPQEQRVHARVAACRVAQGLPVLMLFMWAFLWQEDTFKIWAVTNSNLGNLLGGLFEGVVSKIGFELFDLPESDELLHMLLSMKSPMYPGISWCKLAMGNARAAHAKWHSASALGLPALLLWVDQIKHAQSLGQAATCEPTPGFWTDATEMIYAVVRLWR